MLDFVTDSTTFFSFFFFFLLCIAMWLLGHYEVTTFIMSKHGVYVGSSLGLETKPVSVEQSVHVLSAQSQMTMNRKACVCVFDS